MNNAACRILVLVLAVTACSEQTGQTSEKNCANGGVRCAPDEVCFEGRCVPRNPCGDDSDCPGGSCVNGRCRFPDAGAALDGGADGGQGEADGGVLDGGRAGTDGGGAGDGGATSPDGGPDDGGLPECINGDSQICGSKTGVCRYGTQLCVDGRWGACVGGVAPSPEICDGLDNDCNGTADDRVPPCQCIDGTTQACGVSAVGECRMGVQTCVDGAWAPCVGNVDPRERQCDDRDRDCDGTADFLQPPCLCRNGDTRPCGFNVGVCRQGTETCVAGQWGTCAGGVGPTTTSTDESAVGLCNGLDDNCDGRIDEGCNCSAGETRACGSDVGECRAGTQTCQSNGTWGACNDLGPTMRQCDDKDRDCDGVVDHLQPPCQCRNGDARPCGSSVGECRPGTQTCSSGQWGSCVGGVSPQPEVCDGLDNDCDGTPDNGLRPPTAVACWTNQLGNLVCSDPNSFAVPPLATVQLDGRMSSDPDGQPLAYSWRLASVPAGSSVQISNPSSARPTLFAQLAGDYVICLTVTDTTSCRSQEACVTMHVVPSSRIHIQLVWDKDETDVDLHFMLDSIANFLDDGRGPPGGDPNCNRAKDCSFICKVPEWGAGGNADNPRLDIDDVDGLGPENINLDAPFNQNPYVIAVHYWCDKPGPNYDGTSRGTTRATVRLFVDGVLARSWQRTLSNHQRWYVADIAWNNAMTPPYAITNRDIVENTRIGCN